MGYLYNSWKKGSFDGTFQLGSGGHTIKVMLVHGYTPNIDSHKLYSDVSAYEYGAGSGYTVGGETLAGQVTSQDDTYDRGKFDATNLTWTALGPLSPATPSHAIMYDSTATNSPLICYWELGTTPTTGGDYVLAWHDNGIITLS